MPALTKPSGGPRLPPGPIIILVDRASPTFIGVATAGAMANFGLSAAGGRPLREPDLNVPRARAAASGADRILQQGPGLFASFEAIGGCTIAVASYGATAREHDQAKPVLKTPKPPRAR